MSWVRVSCFLLSLSCYVGNTQSYNGFGWDGDITLTNLNRSTNEASYNYAAANFGGELPSKPYFKGLLHQADPLDACSTISPPPSSAVHSPQNLPWIAIVKRSPKRLTNYQTSCNFVTKVLNAQKSGYSAVIVFNYEDSLLRMNSDNDSVSKLISIPAVFVTHSDGNAMCKQSYPNQVHEITSAEFQPLPGADYLDPYKILIPMAFSFVGILLIAIVVMVVRWCQAIRRKQRSRISKKQLKKLPLVKYKTDDQYDCCAICLEDYEVGEKIRLLPCNHTYHQKCIDPWLLKNKKTCPVCKRRVIPRAARRGRRRSSNSSDSDEGTVDPVSSERTPLLPAPAGASRVSPTEGLGAVGGGGPYGATEGHASSSAYTNRADRRSSHRRFGYEENPFASSSDEVSDTENDLRPNILVQVSRNCPQERHDAGHSLNPYPHRRATDLMLSSSATSPPSADMLSAATHGEVDATDDSVFQPQLVEDDRAPLISNNIIV